MGPGHRGQRGWKKLHLVDGAGVIVAHTLTEATVDDATTGVGLIEALHADLARVTADAAYDTIAFYAAATARDSSWSNKAAPRRRPRSSARDRTIRKMKQIGRRRWKAEAGYYRQARVENAVFRYKSIGDRLRARAPGGQQAEVLIACHILTDDRPGKARLVRHRPMKVPWVGIVLGGVRFMHQRPDAVSSGAHISSGSGSMCSTSKRPGGFPDAPRWFRGNARRLARDLSTPSATTLASRCYFADGRRVGILQVLSRG